MRGFAASFGLLVALIIFACSSISAAAAENLRLGFSGASANQLAAYLAVDKKLFEHYGIAVEAIQAAGTTMIRAVDSASLDTAIVGGGQALSAYLKGVEVRIIGGLVNAVPYQLWARPELSEIKDLKGKKIASTPPGTSLNLATAILLARLGLDPSKDVKLVGFGRLGLAAQALMTGAVDAALLSAPETIEARKAGLRMLMDLSTLRIRCPFTSVVTSRAVLEKSTPALDRFLRGILHGTKIALTEPEIAKKTLAKYMKLSQTEAVEESYKQVVSVYERLPVVPRESIETVIKITKESSSRDPFGVLEMSLLERIDTEGFIKALYSKK